MPDLALPCPIVDLIPHRPPMVLLDRFDDFSLEHGETSVVLAEPHLFTRQGGWLDVAVLVEMIAQSAAAHEGYRRILDGATVGGGFLAGVRDFRIHARPRIGDALRVVAHRGLQIGQMQYVDGRLYRGDQELARGELLFFLSDDLVPEAMPKRAGSASPSDPDGTTILEALKQCRFGPGAFVIEPDFPAFGGHFPDYPILPAVINLMMAEECIGQELGCDWHIRSIARAKFKQPVLPGSRVEVSWSADAADGLADGESRFRFELAIGDAIVARFSIQGGPA